MEHSQGSPILAYLLITKTNTLLGLCLAGLVTCSPSVAQNGSPEKTRPATALAIDLPIVFAVSSDNSLPLADIRDGKLLFGILKDLGDAIAVGLHRKANYLVVPRKRLDGVLTTGMADGVCYVRPEWMDAHLNWSQTIIPNDILLVSSGIVPKPNSLQEVAGKTIGVVLGYKYPELDLLKQNYKREEAPSMSSNMNKLVAGRMEYAIIDRLSLNYQRKFHPEFAAFSELPITKINAACGFSLASKIPFDEIRVTISTLINEGNIERILAQYR